MVETVIISLVTSLIVSLVTFVLGLKSGKNQSDRAKLQDLYKRIYSHFLSLDEAIKEGKPKEWIDFKKIESMYKTEYFPLVKEMKHNGEILYIKKNIAKEAESLEMECMKYAWQCSELANKFQSAVACSTSLFSGNAIVEEKNGRACKGPNPNNCNSYRFENYYLIFDQKRREEILRSWYMDSTDYALVFTTRGNPARNALTFYPGGFNGTVEKTLAEISDILSQLDSYKDLTEECYAIEKKIEKLQKKISARVKDPTNFWETFVGAFTDIFRG